MKKLLAILLALTLALTLVPTLAFAQNEDGAEPGIVEESKETPTEAPEGETTEEPKEEPKEEGKEETKEDSEDKLEDTGDVQAAPQNGDPATTLTGDGTAGNPYKISTAADLKQFRDIVNGLYERTPNPDACAELKADIVLNDGTFDNDGNWSEDGAPDQWTPIGSEDKPYRGTFNGNGKTISGLYVTGAVSAGLFGYTDGAAIQNMAVDGSVEGTTYAGGIAGYAASSSIEGCVNLCRVSASGSGYVSGYAGGIVGLLDRSGDDPISSIQNCANWGAISASDDRGDSAHAGGIAGGADFESGSTITNCYSVGMVSSDSAIHGICCNASTTNSYYLDGTVVNDPTGFDFYRKEKAYFANGKVLAELQKGGGAWAKTGYVAAVGMILPLLSWQEADTADITGSGASDDPYLIYTAAGLKAFRDIVNGSNGQKQNTGAHARLEADIVLNAGTFDENGNWSEDGTPYQWTPIGSGYPYQYCGTFDGGGHTISGLYVKVEGHAGLFGVIYTGTVKNVAVTGYVEGTGSVGGIVGYSDHTTITGCTNAATVRGGASNIGGIVGYLYINGNVKSCANLGSIWAEIDSSRQQGTGIGGIVGSPGDHIIIADCYNAGSITIQDSGTGEYYVPCLGGIVGSTMMAMDGSYISHCFSVGSLTYCGSASVEIRGIIGYAEYWFVNNCYWLEETAEDAVGGLPRRVDNTSAMTKAQFADGTVLKLLKGDRTDSPWADECKYLAAAGMTLPVFEGQTADSHTHSEKTGDCTEGIYCECGYLMHGAKSEHNWGEWVHQTTSHTRHCQNLGCGMTQSENCSGGTATFKDQAKCSICGQPYGQLASGGIRRQPTGGSGAANTSDTTKTVKSGNTGDAGIALYAGMALLSLTGGAWLRRKKH